MIPKFKPKVLELECSMISYTFKLRLQYFLSYSPFFHEQKYHNIAQREVDRKENVY